VLVPTSFASLPEPARVAALTHELVHIERRDWLVVLAEELVRAATWFHPAVWLLLGRIASAREQVVDRRAVFLTGNRRAYLDALYRTARLITPANASVTVPFVHRNHLLARIRLLNQELSMSRSRLFLSTLALAAILIGTTAFSTLSFPLIRTAEAGEILFVGGDVLTPKRIAGDAPSYPEEARKERITGQVVLQTIIMQNGSVRDDIKVLASADERLTKAAIAVVRNWRFEPATLLGSPVDVYYNLTINFRLDADAE
jgi:TonB family protein